MMFMMPMPPTSSEMPNDAAGDHGEWAMVLKVLTPLATVSMLKVLAGRA
jgi:hypothetical protein